MPADGKNAAETARGRRSDWLRQLRRTARAFVGKRATLASLAVVVAFLGMALLAPWLAPHDPVKQSLGRSMLPVLSPGHPLGTDEIGRDLLSRILFGARVSIGVGVVTILAAMLIGTALGLVAGYYGGLADNLIMRATDLLMTFPSLILGICIVSILGPGLTNSALAVVVFSIPIFVRVSRVETLHVRTTEYVEAAKALGVRDRRNLLTHVLPNIISPIIVLATLNIGNAIVTIASLGFLGMGAQPPSPEWGAMLSNGRKFIVLAPHIVLVPGSFLFLFVLALNLLGDGLRDSLDPTLQT